MKRNTYTIWLLLIILLVAAAGIFSLISSYLAEVDAHRTAVLNRAQTVLDASKAGILAHGRMGRYHGERLDIIFDELAQNKDILALVLRAPDGRVVAWGGIEAETPDVPASVVQWDSDKLIISNPVNLLEECGRGWRRGHQRGMNMEDWTPFTPGPYRLAAVLDVSDYHTSVRRDQLRLAVSLLIVVAVLLSGVWTAMLLAKQAALTVLLEGERQRAGHQERMAQLGAGLAHETKNPLGIVRGLAQSIGEQARDGGVVKEQAQKIVDEVDRVIGGVNSFLALSRPREAVQKPVVLDRFFDEFLPLVQMDAAAAGVALLYAPCTAVVLADADLLRRALLNLILNALRASRRGQTVRIEVVRTAATLSLCVTDEGVGIAEEDLARVTEPYFTRFPGGSGLGLSMVEQAAFAHGWRFRIESPPGDGVRAVLEGLRIVEAP